MPVARHTSIIYASAESLPCLHCIRFLLVCNAEATIQLWTFSAGPAPAAPGLPAKRKCPKNIHIFSLLDLNLLLHRIVLLVVAIRSNFLVIENLGMTQIINKVCSE